MRVLPWSDLRAPEGSFKKILHGERPTFTWHKSECPVSRGDRVVLVTEDQPTLSGIEEEFDWVFITFTRLDKSAKGDRIIGTYEVVDNRPVYVASTGVHMDGVGYTRARHLALDAEGGPILDQDGINQTITEAMMDKRQKRAERRMAEADPRKAVRRIADRLKRSFPTFDLDAQSRLEAGIQRLIEKEEEARDG